MVAGHRGQARALHKPLGVVSLLLLVVQWAVVGVHGSGYTTGGDEAECWLTADIFNVTSNIFMQANSTALCSSVSVVQLLLDECPAWLDLTLVTDLPNTLTTHHTYDVEYEVTSYLAPHAVYNCLAGECGKYQVPEAGLRACTSATGLCSPFVDDAATVSQYSASNTTFVSTVGPYGYHFANFSTSLTIDEADIYTVIAHAQIQAWVDLNADGNDELATFDISRAYLAVPVDDRGILISVKRVDRFIIGALATMSGVVLVLCLAAIVRFWDHKVMVYGTRRSLVVMTCAGLVAVVGAALFSEVSLTGCNAFNFGVVLPWCTLYFVLFAKVFRVWWILHGRMKRRVMTENYVLRFAFAFTLVLTGFFALWAWLSPAEVVNEDSNSGDGKYYQLCRGEHDSYFVNLLYAIFITILVIGAYLAKKSWKLSQYFNESRFLAFAVYNCTIVLPLSQGLMKAVDNVRVNYYMTVSEICITVVCTISIMILPKVRQIWHGSTDDNNASERKRKTARQSFVEEIMQGSVILRDELSRAIALHRGGYPIPDASFEKISTYIEDLNRSLNVGQSSINQTRGSFASVAPRMLSMSNVANHITTVNRRASLHRASTGGRSSTRDTLESTLEEVVEARSSSGSDAQRSAAPSTATSKSGSKKNTLTQQLSRSLGLVSRRSSGNAETTEPLAVEMASVVPAQSRRKSTTNRVSFSEDLVSAEPGESETAV